MICQQTEQEVVTVRSHFIHYKLKLQTLKLNPSNAEQHFTSSKYIVHKTVANIIQL